MRFERRLLALSFAAALPATATMLALLWMADVSNEVRVATALSILAVTLFILQVLHHHITFPLRTLANVVGGLREEELSLRAHGGCDGDALGELVMEVNRLAGAMRERYLDTMETDALVRAILAQLDSAIFLFDRKGRLQQTNRAGERLLRMDSSECVGRTIDELALAPCFVQPLPATIEMSFPGGSGRWSVRHSSFRERGQTHFLLAISDLSRVLRDEELRAWQRLARVLTHELNNSLASIQSIAGTLQQIVLSDTPPAGWREDARKGFGIIASRVASLTRFTTAYARLARLPPPDRAPIDIGPLVSRIAALGFATRVHVEPGPTATVLVDADQIEQLLINILQNAVDASLETGGTVTISWRVEAQSIELSVFDEGAGLSPTNNLFVPFFTTKPEGTGIGLVLSRQIAEAHHGALTLQNRECGGCEARLRLPLVRVA
ncbi:MAG TPA: ATP-binding protein [Thermoanaerobaculia bacterium]|nr:ATP-binding protein [Thermoanaerobaculia bacterium]